MTKAVFQTEKKVIFVICCFKCLCYKINDKIKYYKHTLPILFSCIKLYNLGENFLNYLLNEEMKFFLFDIAIYLYMAIFNQKSIAI